MTKQFSFKTVEDGFEALWPVTVSVPQDGGKVEEKTFEARLRVLDLEAIKEAQATGEPFALYKAAIVAVTGGAACRDDKGNPTRFLDKLLAPEWVRDGFDRAFTEFRTGVPAKN